jgi:DNA-binding transcriptional regulator YhcF (GntR family)
MSPRLHLQIDERSGVPVYRQIMDQFKYYVAGVARCGPENQIPSIRELAARAGG